jgi:hypothetical protein
VIRGLFQKKLPGLETESVICGSHNAIANYEMIKADKQEKEKRNQTE